MARLTTSRATRGRTEATTRGTLSRRAVGVTPTAIPRGLTCAATRRRREVLVISSEVATPGESCSEGSSFAVVTVPTHAMARFGGGGSATLQRSKLNLKREVRTVDPKTDDAGGGGNIGKIIHNGGGGGGDDDDDDDYFFEEGDEGDEGDDGFFSKCLPQLYDKISVGAVLSEWYRTVADMPVMLRRAVDMGLFSSAQLVRFLSMDVRPNATRAVQRSLPVTMARGFVGRLMADPAFCHKLIVENGLALAFGLAYEMRMRRDRLLKEWDLAAIHLLGYMAATTSAVWLVAPSRSYGAVSKLPWQETMSNLPNNVFDASGPLRQFSFGARALSALTKSLELAFVGAFMGAATSGLSHLAVMGHKALDADFEPSYKPPSPVRAAWGLSLFFGLHMHLRYQLLGGVDRYFFEHSNYLWSYMTTSGICRITGAALSEHQRPIFHGLPTKPVYVPPVKAPRRGTRKDQSSNVVPAAQLRPKVTKTKGFELTMSNSS